MSLIFLGENWWKTSQLFCSPLLNNLTILFRTLLFSVHFFNVSIIIPPFSTPQTNGACFESYSIVICPYSPTTCTSKRCAGLYAKSPSVFQLLYNGRADGKKSQRLHYCWLLHTTCTYCLGYSCHRGRADTHAQSTCIIDHCRVWPIKRGDHWGSRYKILPPSIHSTANCSVWVLEVVLYFTATLNIGNYRILGCRHYPIKKKLPFSPDFIYFVRDAK